MNDLISRQKAINVFEILADKMTDEGQTVMEQAISVLKDLSSAEPERNRKFLEIVTEYPKICTYPEYEGKPYYAIKYEENGETIVGFGTYKPEVLSQYLQEYFIPSAEPERTAKVVKVEMPNPKNLVWRCVECGQYMHPASWARETRYCSYCGARLELE